MKKLITVASAISALILINGCSSDSATTTAAGSGAEVSVIGVSGVTVGLNGTYSTGCYTTGGGSTSTKEDVVISGSTWTNTTTDYTDSTCVAGPDAGAITATIGAGSDLTIAGWKDGSGSIVSAPTAADGSGLLSDTEPFTPLTVTVTAVTGNYVGQVPVGYVAPLFYIVDDTGTNNMLYRDKNYENGDLHAGTMDPFTKQ